mmetsp:Transcript_62396/g.184620  ORF Transcript_62396/g.184620 Transcript_62396/m.184620 type:complete len:305 (-) Transcript_62396:164-1078(-)
MRSEQGIQFFPRVFFLYFTLFHVYFFSCPFGFSYTSLVSTGLFLLHSMLFFINRYELPAILNGTISLSSPRTPGIEGERHGGGDGENQGADVPRTPPTAHYQGQTRNYDENLQVPDRGARVRGGGGSGGGISGDANIESLPSFSSMSSLRRGHRNTDDDDDSSFMYYLNGEVVMQRENRSSQSLQTIGSLSTTAHRDVVPEPEVMMSESPQAVSPSNLSDNQGDVQDSTHQRMQLNEYALGLTPRQSNVEVSSADNKRSNTNNAEISMPILVPTSSSALSCFDWDGRQQNRCGEQAQDTFANVT